MKKIISLFTTLCIVFGVLGIFTVFADGTSSDLEIGTLAQLEAFRDDVNGGNTYEGKTVKLTADIDMSEKYGEGKESWTPIGILSLINSDTLYRPFQGTFNGNGHTISNLYLFFDSDSDSGFDKNSIAAGLFGSNGGIIKNLNVSGSIISNYYDCAGGIAGNNDGVIEKCSCSGYIESRAHVGGIAGGNGGTMTDCFNTADVVTTVHCGGGIVGTNYTGKILRCYNVGNLTRGEESRSNFFGSITGGSDTEIDCYYLEGTYDIGVYVTEGTDPTTALTTEQFADKTNFTNWDFDTVWQMDETLKRPVLRSNTEEPPTPPHTHTLVHQTEKPATCTETGNREYWQCSGCGNVFEDEDATLEIDGIPTIDAAGHTEVTDTAVEPTCETDGKTAGSHCSVCNTVITEQTIIPKLNHSWGAWSITTEPTFDVTGKAEHICKNDNTHKEIVNLPILTDTTVWTEDLKIEPAETENGSVTYTSQYGNVTVIIPALNPQYDFSIKYENGKAIVTAKQDGTYTLIFASYSDGRLLSVSVQDTELAKGENEPIEPEQSFNKNGKVRVMLWDSLIGMKPLCSADEN